MTIINRSDNGFDIQAVGSCSMALQLDRYEVTYLLFSANSNWSETLYSCSYQTTEGTLLSVNEINSLLSEDTVFNSDHISDIRILLPSEKFTLVPTPIYTDTHKELFFGLNHFLEDDETILVNRLLTPDCYLLFAADKQLCNMISNFTHCNASPIHHLKPLLNNLFGASDNTNTQKITLYVGYNTFTMVVSSGNTLKFCNSFRFKAATDLIYFLLYTIKTLKIQEIKTISCIGRIAVGDDIYRLLSNYFEDISIENQLLNPIYNLFKCE